MKENQDFEIGDIVINKKPYEGEHPLLIIGIDGAWYKCAWGVGKYSVKSGWDFKYLEHKPFDMLSKLYYKKVGHFNLN